MTKKIDDINTKVGCGKTTMSTNQASYNAAHGFPTALFDYDPQDSATRWLAQRPDELGHIHGVAAAHQPEANVTRTFQMRVPPETRRLILDTPASLKRMDLIEILRGAAAVIVPILPSTIDAHVTAAFTKDLETELRMHAPGASVAIVANRVRRNTRAFQTLLRFLDAGKMAPVACLRDSQNYVQASAGGIGIHDMKPSPTRIDREQWQPLVDWLEALRVHAHSAPHHSENQRIFAG